MKTWIIYKHTNKINNKCYVGMTCQKTYARWGSSGKQYWNQPKFYNAILKYGWDGFYHEVIERDIKSLDKANERETYWIDFYDSIKSGYNVSKGGQGNLGVPCPEWLKNKLSDERKGSGNPMYGKHPRSEFKAGIPNTRLSKKILQFSTNDEFIKEWPSVAEAQRQLRIANQNIIKVCQGKRKHAGGYKWRYKDED